MSDSSSDPREETKVAIEGNDRFWSKLYNQNDRWECFQGTLRMKAIEHVPQDAKFVLDLGCGNGVAMKLLKDKEIPSCGVDISPRALEEAAVHGEVVQGRLDQLPIADRKAPCALLMDVFHFLVDKAGAIREAHRVLKDHGLLIMTTPFRVPEMRLDHRFPFNNPLTVDDVEAHLEPYFELEYSFAQGWLPTQAEPLERFFPNKVHESCRALKRSRRALLLLRKRSIVSSRH